MSNIKYLHFRPFPRALTNYLTYASGSTASANRLHNTTVSPTGGFTIAYQELSPTLLKCAIAICSDKDLYNKAEGRIKSCSRLLDHTDSSSSFLFTIEHSEVFEYSCKIEDLITKALLRLNVLKQYLPEEALILDHDSSTFL